MTHHSQERMCFGGGLILVLSMIGYPLLPLSLLSREFGQFYAMLYGGHIWEPWRPKMVPLNSNSIAQHPS